MRALLLDLDDTLLDYSGGVDECWAAACATLGPAAGVDPDRLMAALTQARIWFWSDPDRQRRERVNMLRAWERIVVHAMTQAGLEADGLAAAIAGDFAARRRAMMGLFPDAVDCLERLRDRGVPLALVTNGDASQQRDKIERHGLARFFDAIVIEGEFGAGKPDESVYRHALSTLGTEPEEAWMVGDHIEFDVDGPQRLGLRGIWLDRAGQGVPGESPVRPYRVIHSLRELVDPVATPPPTSRRRS